MTGHNDGSPTDIGFLKLLSAAILAMLALIVIPMGTAGAQESYPPAAIVNTVDPFGCSPTGISGAIGHVQPGSTLNVALSASGTPVGQANFIAPADGIVRWTVANPNNTFGPATITATGINTAGEPFTLVTNATIVSCPAQTTTVPTGTLPTTGSSSSGTFVTLGLAAVLAGGFLIVVSARRRRGARLA